MNFLLHGFLIDTKSYVQPVGSRARIISGLVIFCEKDRNRLSNRVLAGLLIAFSIPILNTVRVLAGYDTALQSYELFSNTNWVSKKGISLSAGLAIPIIGSNFFENIRVESRADDITILPEDEQVFKQAISEERFFLPVRMKLAIGYNFSL